MPAPFFRLLQSLEPGDATAYYTGNPIAQRTFVAMSPVGQPGGCMTTAGSGWDTPLLAGPLRTLDMRAFPAPFAVRP